MRTSLLVAAALLVCAPRASNAQVTLIQINDIYRIDEVDSGIHGGMSRVSTIIDRAKKRGEKVLIVHGGDFISPSLESRYFGGIQMIDAMNFLHAKAPMLVAPGNHEYDASADTIVSNAIAASRFPWLAANLRLTTANTAANARIRPDTIVRIGGLNIGFFGLTLLDDPRTNVAVDANVLQIAEQRIQSLEERGADVIIGLTHLDISVDRAMAALRRAHPKFQWIVSGHEHYTFEYPQTDTTAWITNGESNARVIWKATLTPTKSAPRLAIEKIALDSTVAIDPVYTQQITQRYRLAIEKVIPFYNQQIGTTAVALDGTEQTVRGTESTLGNYLTDVMRGAFPDIPADIAILGGGSIRIDDQIMGPIRWEHLARTFGFPTRVALVWLRGSDVVSRVLEQSVSGDPGNGRFLQVSGVHFKFDRRKPAGSRVSDVRVMRGGSLQPIEPAAMYWVAVPDYNYGGGDGYTFRSRAILTIPPGPDLKLLVFDALMTAYAKGQPIAPKLEGRIQEITD